MFTDTVLERATALITPIVENLGYEVVEIEFKRVGKSDTLTVYIHKQGGITLDDCVRVNEALDLPLEENDITEGGAYTLNISSPGLDRPIVTDRDFARNIGEEVEALFTTPLAKKKSVHGILVSHDDFSVKLLVKNVEQDYQKANIKVLRPYIDMNKVKKQTI